jgi:hypothetical protein
MNKNGSSGSGLAFQPLSRSNWKAKKMVLTPHGMNILDSRIKSKLPPDTTFFLNGDTTIKPSPHYLDRMFDKIFKVKTLKDSIKLLKDIVPQLEDCFDYIHPSDKEVVILGLRKLLVKIRAKYHLVRSVPSDLLELEDYITDLELASKESIVWVNKTIKRVLWDAEDPNYITVKKAADKSGGLFTEKNFGKHLRKKSNDIRWMNLSKHSKVNEFDFNSYLKKERQIEKTRERINSKKGTNKANIQ